ncbi:hypothetical protein KFK09_020508 [Dendrobium nobile]|uniref:E3 ubiquitin-protein ligase listerin n=1 Tax=Dendrobium nobile TaxID=94219 RepID=A0A8T3AT67_DENNO|nr:hypothetical protein KFK09_020508 [Dendrobium nobile]
MENPKNMASFLEESEQHDPNVHSVGQGDTYRRRQQIHFKIALQITVSHVPMILPENSPAADLQAPPVALFFVLQNTQIVEDRRPRRSAARDDLAAGDARTPDGSRPRWGLHSSRRVVHGGLQSALKSRTQDVQSACKSHTRNPSVCLEELYMGAFDPLFALFIFLARLITGRSNDPLARLPLFLYAKSRTFYLPNAIFCRDFLLQSSKVARKKPVAECLDASLQKFHWITKKIDVATKGGDWNGSGDTAAKLLPFAPVDVECTRSLGISEVKQRKWLLSLTAFVRNQNGAIAEAIRIWKSNFDKEFDGVEECPICYSIIHTTNHSLPRLACKTCKHKFHSACLYKWFSSSHKSTCPLCQTPF